VELVVGRWNIAYVNCIINVAGIPSPHTSRPIRVLHSQKEGTPSHSTVVMAEILNKRHLSSDTGHEGIWTFHAS